ncbi:MAG: hypothetical protein KDC83_01940 [Flavobacteriales bacterium]|nr:hypothetical protein [Flavobacteriales bacterium]
MNAIKTGAILILLSAFFVGCKTQGCTDEDAKNFDSKADEDNGECVYVEGCTDPKASNYNSSAKKDNGTCSFTGNAIFWTDYPGTGSKIFVAIQKEAGLGYQPEGDFDGFANKAPACQTADLLTLSKSAGTYTYKAERADGSDSWEGTLVVEKDKCVDVELRTNLTVAARATVSGSSTGSGDNNDLDVSSICSDEYSITLAGPTRKEFVLKGNSSMNFTGIKDGTYSIAVVKSNNNGSGRVTCSGRPKLITNVEVKGSQIISLIIGRN